MKRAEPKAVQLTSTEIAASITALEGKLTEAQEAVRQAEATCGRDWQSLLAGGENRLREQLTIARDRADALMLALTAAREDLESARQRERRAARLARRGELVQVIDQRAQAADRLDTALSDAAASLLDYFSGVRAARSITGPLKSPEVPEGIQAVELATLESTEHLQRLVELTLRDALPGLWAYTEAQEAVIKPIAQELRAIGDAILGEFDARYSDAADRGDE